MTKDERNALRNLADLNGDSLIQTSKSGVCSSGHFTQERWHRR